MVYRTSEPRTRPSKKLACETEGCVSEMPALLTVRRGDGSRHRGRRWRVPRISEGSILAKEPNGFSVAGNIGSCEYFPSCRVEK